MGEKVLPGQTTDFWCGDCHHDDDYCGQTNSKTRHLVPNPLISYTTNSLGFRSDEFDKDLTNDNFVFSGCSFTFGTGIPIEMIWGKQLNDMLGGDKFFNLGVNANCIYTSIYNVFEYIWTFGKPKGVFILLPNYERFIHFSNAINHHREQKFGMYMLANGHQALDFDISRFLLFTQIRSLEEYCKAIGVPLFWGSWSSYVNQDINVRMVNLVENYVDLGPEEFDFDWIDKAPKELKKNKYWKNSRDEHHMGGKYHYQWAKIFKDAWDEKNNQ